MKKLLSVILALAFITTSLITSVGAAENQPTSEELEAVIKAVRSKIDIPEDCTDFSWNYYAGDYYSHSSWQLRWHDIEYSKYATVDCDKEGTINNYRFFDYEAPNETRLPEKSPDEFTAVAEAFAQKLAPQTKGHFRLTSAGNADTTNHRYFYKYTRFENDVEVPDNKITVSVDYTTGTPMSFSCNFDESAEFAKSDELIGAEKAREILATKQKMVLSYRLKSEFDEKTGESTGLTAYLVYTPETGYLSVDAVTGKIYTERNTWTINNSGAANKYQYAPGAAKNEEMSMDSTADSGYGNYKLSDEEVAQLEVLNKLITRDDAIKSITDNKYLYVDEAANAVSARLVKAGNYYPYYRSKVGDAEQKYVWSITLTNPSADGGIENKFFYDNPGVYATVDAQDGSLISFNTNVNDYYYYSDSDSEIPKLAYSADDVRKISDEFLAATAPEKYKNTRFSSDRDFTAIDYADAEKREEPIYRCKSHNYVRVNEGIDFSDNALHVSVDRVSGKVVSFNYYWYDEISFESPKNVITPDKAFDSLYTDKGFGINYEINSNYTYNKYLADSKTDNIIDYDKLYETSISTRAVYSGYDMGTTIVRASDGKLINYSGDEYVSDSDYKYTDIDSHWAKNTILRFFYAGIGPHADKFLPDEDITVKELTKLFNDCRMYGEYTPEADGETVTRVAAVKYLIDTLGYEKVAKLENVFITDFADNLDLKPEDVGYIAIARGFGLVEGDGENFRAYDNLTRAEAFVLVNNILNYMAANR